MGKIKYIEALIKATQEQVDNTPVEQHDYEFFRGMLRGLQLALEALQKEDISD